MRSRLSLILLGVACLLIVVNAKCNLDGEQATESDFPNLMKHVAFSYIMGVEYSFTEKNQTDYFKEYYEDAGEKKGRVDSHINGNHKKYMYRPDSEESWVIEGKTCEFRNSSEKEADFFKDHPTDWQHTEEGYNVPTTIGPSAMFKIAYDAWMTSKNSQKVKKMAYMGKSIQPIRGENAIFWRRCTKEDEQVDYFFADEGDQNPYDENDEKILGKKATPLRVSFYKEDKLQQSYDIISFQPLIPVSVSPFELPKGLLCSRSPLLNSTDMPDFTDSDVLLSSEVLYQSYTSDPYELQGSYYSTFTLVLDRRAKLMAYYYSSWNSTKKEKDDEPFVNVPHYIIYDLKNGYAYRIHLETGKCSISRERDFYPKYRLPNNRGSIDLTNPMVLFPNNELSFLTTGKDRGLEVDIFEGELNDFPMDKDNKIDRMVVTHSFLKPKEKVENTVEIKAAPTQIDLHLFRKDNPGKEEVLTFNIFGFTTQIPRKQYFFDVTRCFKNDDDYLYFTIGFEVQRNILSDVVKKIPEIEREVIAQITVKSSLNALRVPKVMTNIKGNYIYVSLLILDRPPVELDFVDKEEGKTVIVGEGNDDLEVAGDFNKCAKNCLERPDCWGFSQCGTNCFYGSTSSVNVATNTNCTLYRIYSNDSLTQTKESQIRTLTNFIETGQFKVLVIMDNGDQHSLKAISAQVSNPAEDDSFFDDMGHKLNPRMKIQKAGYKLITGSEVKNMGKLRFDECQRECLDFKDCETVSFCLIDSRCVLSTKYGSDLKPGDMKADDLCSIVTRKYTDHFDRAPGVFLKRSDGTPKDATTVEDCARACLKETGMKCLSFDHCAGMDKQSCTLYTVHFPSKQSRSDIMDLSPSCGHYTIKFSLEFKRKENTRLMGSKIPPIMNLTLEDCAKACFEYGQGTCYGYDFCQDSMLYSSTCTLFDSDPSKLKSVYSSVCTNYARTAPEYQHTSKPFTNTYAAGIGFLCFLIGGFLGIVAVFVIAYIRVNKQ